MSFSLSSTVRDMVIIIIIIDAYKVERESKGGLLSPSISNSREREALDLKWSQESFENLSGPCR